MILILATGIGLSAPCAFADDWVMAFHDSRHTGQSSEVVTAPLSLAWTWVDTYSYDNDPQFNVQGRFWLPLYYQGKLCFQGGNNSNRLFCLNPASGSKLWEWDNPGYTQSGYYLFQFDNYPAVANGRIVNASTDFTASVDVATGGDAHVAYDTNGGWPYGGSASWNNIGYVQYVRTDDGSEGFNLIQDPKAWIYGDRWQMPDNRNTYTDWSFRVPAVDKGILYYSMSGVLTAADALCGRVLWTWGKMNFYASPAVSNGVVYFYSSYNRQFVALNAAQAVTTSLGSQVPTIWSVPMSSAYSPIVSDGTVYVGAADGTFYALDAATGARKWTFPTQSSFTSLQIPAISGDLIYVPTSNGVLYALQKSTGAQVWSYTGGAAWGPVVVGGGMVFASDATNKLYAFQPQSARVGPAVTSLSTTRFSNASSISVNLTGSGFFGGGSVSAVQSVYLDNSAGTILTGYTVASDQSITGIVIPAGLTPGTYHIKVQTSVGKSANEPTYQVEAANSSFVSTLGFSWGQYGWGTSPQFQRHLARTNSGGLVAVFIAPPVGTGGTQYPNFTVSWDGGLTWTAQQPYFADNNSMSVWAPTTSLWTDAQDHINISSIQWPSYQQAFSRYSLIGPGWLSPDPGLPNYPSGTGADYPGPMVSEPGGRLWLALETGGVVKAYYSDNAGQSWTPTAQINQSTGTSPLLVLYNGRPAVIYSDGGALAWSMWNGASWNAPQILPGFVNGVGPNMSAAVSSGGQVYVTYSPASGGVYYSTYAAPNWSAPALLDPSGSSPSVTTDGTDFWCFYANSAGDLVYRRTSSGQWSSAVAITSDGNHNTAPSTLPLSPGGQIPVIWTSGTATGYLVKSAVVGAVQLPPAPAVSVAPQSVTLSNGQTQQFTATVINTGNTAVNWTMSPIVGSLSSTGLYTAPASIATQQTVTITATSQAGSGIAATAAVTLIPAPRLSISQTHTGNFSQGQTGAVYAVVVSNAPGAGPTNGTVTLNEALPAGLTLVSMSGTGWSCGGSTCSRADALNPGASYPMIAVTVNVAGNAGTPLVAQAGVFGGGSASAVASDTTIVLGAPSLSVTESHIGNFTQGQAAATYTVVIANSASSAPTVGTVTLTQTLPAALSLVSMSGSGWSCTGTTCTRSDPLAGGAAYAAVTVTVNVSVNAASPLATQVSVSGGGSETATGADSTTVAAVPLLAITQTHLGNFTQGQASAVYTITVSNNIGAATTTGTVTVTETVPSGLSLLSMTGAGWSCFASTCTRSDGLNGGASYPPIAVTVQVPGNASSPQVAQVTVYGGGSATSTATDSTVIVATPRLVITETHSGSFTQGQAGAVYTAIVSNAATAGPTTDTVTLTESLPGGMTLVSMSGAGWSCTGSTCTRTDILAPGASYPAVTVTVNVASNASSLESVQASVATPGSPTASVVDSTVIVPLAALSIFKSHTGNFTQGQAGANYIIGVSNASSAGPTNGVVTVSENTPAGLTLISISGAGWSCTGSNCTRGDVLSAGASYPPITVTVNVAPNAPAEVDSTSTVSGGGSGTASYCDKTTIIATPVLSVTENSASFTQGQNGAVYTVLVSNSPSAGPTSGTVTLTQTLPAGLTLVSMSGSGWLCSGPTCTRGDVLKPGTSYPPVTVAVNVAANASSPLTAQVSVSGGSSPPTNAIDPTIVLAAPTPVLNIVSVHTGSFSQGLIGAIYTLTVSNQASAGPTSGVIAVTESAPPGLTEVTMSGSGWLCAGTTCTRGDVLNPGTSYPPITVSANVSATAPALMTNLATVSGGGDPAPGHSTSDPTTVKPVMDVSGLVKMAESGVALNRGTKLWNATMTITNTSGAAIAGPLQFVLVNLSPNATLVNAAGMRNGSPYLTVSAAGLAPDASLSVPLQFSNPTGGYINFGFQLVSGAF